MGKRAQLPALSKRIRLIQGRLDRATLGPWTAKIRRGTAENPLLCDVVAIGVTIAQLAVDPLLEGQRPNIRADAELITSAREDLAFLIKAVETFSSLVEAVDILSGLVDYIAKRSGPAGIFSLERLEDILNRLSVLEAGASDDE